MFETEIEQKIKFLSEDNQNILKNMLEADIISIEDIDSVVDKMRIKELSDKEDKIKPFIKGKDGIKEGQRIKNGKLSTYYEAYLGNNSSQRYVRCSTRQELVNKVYDMFCSDKLDVRTINNLFEDWKKFKLENTNAIEDTVKRNEQYYNKYLKDKEISNKNIKKITSSELKMFYRSLSKEDITRKDFVNIKTVVNGIFSYCIEVGILQDNVALSVTTKDIPFKDSESKLDQVFTKKEREKLLTYLENLPEQTIYTLAIRLFFTLDIRIGELKGLTLDDILLDKFEYPAVYIRKQCVDRYIDGKLTKVEVNHTKAKKKGGDRLEILTPRALKVIEEIKDGFDTSGKLLKGPVGETLSTNTFNKNLKKYCKLAGIPYYSSHRIRNYSISEQSKVLDIIQVQKNSGHLDYTTTLGYLRSADMSFDTEYYEKWCAIHN